MTSQPTSVANVTALSRPAKVLLSATSAFERVNEVTSLYNYATILRAIDPTRKIAIANADTTTALSLAMRVDSSRSPTTDPRNVLEDAYSKDLIGAGFLRSMDPLSQYARDLSMFLPLISSLDPAISESVLLETVQSEEVIAMSGGIRDAMYANMSVKALYPMTWSRLFKNAGDQLRDFPIGRLLDAAFMGAAYDTEESLYRGEAKKKDKRLLELAVAARPLFLFARDAAVDPFGSNPDVVAALFTGQTTLNEGYTRFAGGAILLDALHLVPRIAAMLSNPSMTLITKDPGERFENMTKIARMIRYISLQPMCMYASILASLLEVPEVRAALSLQAGDFYSTDIYNEFAKRATGLKLGHVYRHICADVLSGGAITAHGEHTVVRMPRLLEPLFSSLGALQASTASGVAISGSVYSPGSFTGNSSKLDLATFMRWFLRCTGPDDLWSRFSADFDGALGYERPSGGHTHDYLNPRLVMSDGWTASERVDYTVATRSMTITPVRFRAGAPSKIALTSERDLAPEHIATETSVERVELLDPRLDEEKRLALLTKGLDGLGPNRPPMWLIRRSADHTPYDSAIGLSLGGRLPSSMWNGDLDASPIPHTTFSDFALDLNMSPNGLLSIVRNKESNVNATVQALINRFFTRDASDPRAMAIPDAETYGLGNLKFASAYYYQSARSVALTHSTMVWLCPLVAVSPLTLVSREFSGIIESTVRSFRTVVAEPIQPTEHQAALRDVVAIDADMASAWGTTLAI